MLTPWPVPQLGIELLTFCSKGDILVICEKISTRGFSALIDSTRSLESPKKTFNLKTLGITQESHALFGAWEFFAKNWNFRVLISLDFLYSILTFFDPRNRLKVVLEHLRHSSPS